MKLKFIHNNRILQILQATTEELNQIEMSSTAHWIAYNGRSREKKSKSYLHNYQWLPGGFWHKMAELGKMGYNVKIENIKDFVRNDITLDDFTEWVNDLPMPEKYQPRWYQIRGAWLAVKYRISRGEFATSAGKSLILYLVSRYIIEKLLDENEKILIVVPSIMLVKQLAGDFNDYQTDDFLQVDQIYGGSKRNKSARVVVGNIDSLINYDEDFFQQFGTILYDEAHKLMTSQYQRVIEYMHNIDLKCIYSVSGTFYDAKASEDFPAMAISGPILMRVPAWQLIEEGSVTPVRILVLKMIHSYQTSEQYYNHPDCQSINKRNDFEMKFIRSSSPRFKKIVDIASKLEYNQLMLFKSVSYCKAFAAYLTEKFPDKTVMVIIGDVGNEERERIKQFTEKNTNVIICASVGTMATGVSINNLGGLHQVEGSKSFILIRQSIGRTLRLHPSKKYAQIIDYVDVFPKSNPDWGGPKLRNIAAKHSKIRKKIYDGQKFPWTEKTIKL